MHYEVWAFDKRLKIREPGRRLMLCENDGEWFLGTDGHQFMTDFADAAFEACDVARGQEGEPFEHYEYEVVMLNTVVRSPQVAAAFVTVACPPESKEG